MTKEMYDYIDRVMNSHNFYDIKQSETNPNFIYLVWKGTNSIFATLDYYAVEQAMEEEKGE